MEKYGQWFRFITPVLVSIALYILSQLGGKLDRLDAHFTNHLSEHKSLEVTLERRLTQIETQMYLLVKTGGKDGSR